MSATETEAAHELAAYLGHRAQAEGLEFKLTPEWFIDETRKLGHTIFETEMFGVRLSRETGKVKSDEQQPRPDFLDEWNSRAIN